MGRGRRRARRLDGRSRIGLRRSDWGGGLVVLEGGGGGGGGESLRCHGH